MGGVLSSEAGYLLDIARSAETIAFDGAFESYANPIIRPFR